MSFFGESRGKKILRFLTFEKRQFIFFRPLCALCGEFLIFKYLQLGLFFALDRMPSKLVPESSQDPV